jgi:ribosomal protein S12 methylthiotransferase accessory factor
MNPFAEPAPKKHFQGTHRSRSLADSVAAANRVRSKAGITRVANVTGLDTIGLPVVAVYRPNARSVSVAQGKGLSIDAALASGLMEAIETHHAEHVERPLRLARASELRARARVVNVDRLPRLVSAESRLNRPTLWIEGFDLMHDASSWVPYEMVHTNYTFPLPTGSGVFMMSSNGLASGNHALEAISHSICEVVERDAVTLWSLQGAWGGMTVESIRTRSAMRIASSSSSGSTPPGSRARSGMRRVTSA